MKKIMLRAVISLSFLILLFYLMRKDIPVIFQALGHVHRGLFYVCILFFLSTVVVLAKRLQLMFGVARTRLPLGACLNLTFIGYFFNNFLPTSVGGDVVKALCAARVTGKAVNSVTSILMDRLFGLFTFVLIPSISLLFYMRNVENKAIPFLVYSFLAVSVFFFFLLFNRPLAKRFRFVEKTCNRFGLGKKVRTVYEGLHKFKRHKEVVLYALVLSVSGQVVAILVLYGMSVALGVYSPVIYFFLLVPLVHLVSMLPSLNGLGIREGAYIYFLSPAIGKEYAAALGVLWLGLLFLLSVIGGILYLVRQDYHVRFPGQAQRSLA